MTRRDNYVECSRYLYQVIIWLSVRDTYICSIYRVLEKRMPIDRDTYIERFKPEVSSHGLVGQNSRYYEQHE